MTSLQPIIMAAGPGSRVPDLVTRKPKALLPVANKPMLWYPVNMLAKAGFSQAIIVVSERHCDAIRKSLIEVYEVKMTLDFVEIPDDKDWSTADSLRHIAPKLRDHMLIISCDLITDISIQQFADLHRIKNATVTMLLTETPDASKLQVPGGKSNKKLEKDVIGLELENSDLKEKPTRVAYLAAEADLEGSVDFSFEFLRDHPKLELRYDRYDAHMYIMNKSVLSFLKEESRVNAIKAELIPKLAKIKKELKPEELEGITSAYNYYDDDHLASKGIVRRLASDWSSYPSAENGTEYKVHAYTQTGGYCVRANNIMMYCEANRTIPRQLIAEDEDATKVQTIHPTVKSNKRAISADSMVGEGTTIGEKVSIQKSTIGRHCVIKDHVKISNSIIMDYTVIEQGSSVTGSVISSYVEVQERCELNGTVVAEGIKLGADKKYNNETVMAEERMMAF